MDSCRYGWRLSKTWDHNTLEAAQVEQHENRHHELIELRLLGCYSSLDLSTHACVGHSVCCRFFSNMQQTACETFDSIPFLTIHIHIHKELQTMIPKRKNNNIKTLKQRHVKLLSCKFISLDKADTVLKRPVLQKDNIQKRLHTGHNRFYLYSQVIILASSTVLQSTRRTQHLPAARK